MPTMALPFSEEEYKTSIAAMKNNKAAGRDDVMVDQLKQDAQQLQALARRHSMQNHSKK